jgi:hypothetical protein
MLDGQPEWGISTIACGMIAHESGKQSRGASCEGDAGVPHDRIQ